MNGRVRSARHDSLDPGDLVEIARYGDPVVGTQISVRLLDGAGGVALLYPKTRPRAGRPDSRHRARDARALGHAHRYGAVPLVRNGVERLHAVPLGFYRSSGDIHADAACVVSRRAQPDAVLPVVRIGGGKRAQSRLQVASRQDGFERGALGGREKRLLRQRRVLLLRAGRLVDGENCRVPIPFPDVIGDPGMGKRQGADACAREAQNLPGRLTRQVGGRSLRAAALPQKIPRLRLVVVRIGGGKGGERRLQPGRIPRRDGGEDGVLIR